MSAQNYMQMSKRQAQVMTIGQIMRENNGIGPGFDALRIFLAFAVIFRHSFPLALGWEGGASSGFLWSATNAIVPAFFAVSGFLVMGSALRLDLIRFGQSRFLRIVPALAVDTFVTILIIGSIFTVLPLEQYFSSPQTLAYLFNIFGYIHYFLPGVFESNPYPGVVNGALWTIKPELGCYLVLGFMMFIGVHGSSRIIFLAIALIVGLILIDEIWGEYLPFVFSMIFGNPGALLVPNFLLGAALFLLRDYIPYSKVLFMLCAATVLLSGFFLPEESYAGVPTVSVFLMPVYAYLVLFIGVTKIPRMPLFSRGDYSYGVYLYGFPIQQALVATLKIDSPFLLFFMTIPIVVILAVFSWHLVEKPTLRFRRSFSLAAKREEERSRNG
jgi:peptidoglycan/LPS O-acetylase OafA/YrhL